MRKLTKASLSELAKSKEIISFLEQKQYVGGGSGSITDPCTQEEFEDIVNTGNWTGGWVLGLEEKYGELSYTGGTGITSGYIGAYNGKTQVPEIKGDGNASHPYTKKQFNEMFEKGSWNGGFVKGMGYVMDDATCISFNPNEIHKTGDPLYDLMYEGGYITGFRAGITEGDIDDVNAIIWSGISAMLSGSGDGPEYRPEMQHQAIGVRDGLNAGRAAIGKSSWF